MCPAGNPWPQPPAQKADSSLESDLQLKVFNCGNKKDFKVYTLRGVRCDGSIQKLKEIIYNQCGSEIVPPIEKMEVGYYNQSKKLWINNRLDLQDAWALISRGDRITLWCVGIAQPSRKRDNSHESDEEQELEVKKTKKVSKAEEQRAIVEDYLQQLKEKHTGKFTRFQLKLWAEMLAVGTHDDLNEPPASSMFSPQTPKSRSAQSENESVVSGMVSVVHTLCKSVLANQNITNENTTHESEKSVLSPVKKAQLRSTYMQQLTELRKLQEAGIITKEEYEEQRSDLVDNMRHLSA
jgi:hypothetical protein